MHPDAPRSPDPESERWLGALTCEGPAREGAARRLHDLLLRVAYAEAHRRRHRLPESLLEELDDLCTQAASDALMAVRRKLGEYSGAARFTTWACKFVILEISSRLRVRAWKGRPVASLDGDERVKERLADSAPSALQAIEHRELLAALARAVREELTERQRVVFRAAVLEEVPIDVLAERLRSSRGAVYKVLHDARRKLREALSRAGYAENVA